MKHFESKPKKNSKTHPLVPCVIGIGDKNLTPKVHLAILVCALEPYERYPEGHEELEKLRNLLRGDGNETAVARRLDRDLRWVA